MLVLGGIAATLMVGGIILNIAGIISLPAMIYAGAAAMVAASVWNAVALYFMAGWCGSCIPESQSW